jgi:hypothetical protein
MQPCQVFLLLSPRLLDRYGRACVPLGGLQNRLDRRPQPARQRRTEDPATSQRLRLSDDHVQAFALKRRDQACFRTWPKSARQEPNSCRYCRCRTRLSYRD